MSARFVMRVVGLLLIVSPRLHAAKDAAEQGAGEHHQFVKAGPATLQITIRGRGDPIVFIPSRGRGVDDFDDLSKRLVQAGYRAILPEPRGIGGSTGPLEGITYHDLASDVAATIESVVAGPATVIGHAFGNRVARTLASDTSRPREAAHTRTPSNQTWCGESGLRWTESERARAQRSEG